MQCRVLCHARSTRCLEIAYRLIAVGNLTAGYRSNALMTVRSRIHRCSARLLHYNRIKSLPTTIGPA
ncbi:UNVERIFIED_ORG: hypothetical protein GGR78_000961 [Xanthomonas campestris]